MNKVLSLIKACMTENMSLFRIKKERENRISKIGTPVFLTIIFFFSIWTYANIIMEPLVLAHLEYVLLTLFVLLTFILTLIEGIYKSSGLLFNCKDDNLLLSLPIKKSTVLFIRVFKFYIFEVLYNALFLLPAMVVYVRYVNVGITYYLVSLIALLLLPIIPIVISCIIGAVISNASSKFRYKNLAQIVITVVFLLFVFYLSFNLQNLIVNISEKAVGIHNLITKIYYPASLYIKLVTSFNVKDLLIFVFLNVTLFVFTIIILSNIYFKINSKAKSVKTKNKLNNYKIRTNKPVKTLIKKEFNRFLNSPVFVTNAGFGLVLFIVGCIAITLKFDSVVNAIISEVPSISITQIKTYMPVILFGLVCFASLMSSITSSMISLEGKSFNILKSLPIKPFTIITSKILTAVIIMVPFILIGDIIIFIKFTFNILEILIILAASIILPLVAETFGIIINLKYPKMDAENDTQVVKQSTSSMIAVFLGMGLTALTIFLLIESLTHNINVDLTILGGLSIYILIYISLLIILRKKSVKMFNRIIV